MTGSFTYLLIVNPLSNLKFLIKKNLNHCEVEQTVRNTIKIWEMTGVDIPVASGAERPLLYPLNTSPFVHGDDGLGNTFLPPPKISPSDVTATDMIMRLSHQFPGKLTLLTTQWQRQISPTIRKQHGLFSVRELTLQ